MVIDVAFANVLVLGGRLLQRLGYLRDQICRKLIPLGSVGFHSVQLGGPCCQRGTLERSGCQGGGIADAQRADLLRFAVVVFLAEGGQLRSVLLFNDTALAIELLDLV